MAYLRLGENLDGKDETHVYWLNGIAATVKSTIARTVAGDIYYERGRLGASFFFSRGGGDIGSPDKFIITVAILYSL